MVKLIHTIFELFRSQSRPLVFIRPKAITEPEIYTGDFDLLIRPEDAETFFSLVHQACADSNYSFSLKRHRLDKMEIRLFSKDGNQSVLMDVWSELDIKAPGIPKGSAILAQTLIDKGYVQFDDDFHAVFEPNFAALFYLSHLYSKRKSLESNEVQARLNYYRKLPELESNIIKWLENPSSEVMQQANES
jgi:ribosomal protein L33